MCKTSKGVNAKKGCSNGKRGIRPLCPSCVIFILKTYKKIRHHFFFSGSPCFFPTPYFCSTVGLILFMTRWKEPITTWLLILISLEIWFRVNQKVVLIFSKWVKVNYLKTNLSNWTLFIRYFFLIIFWSK